MGLVRPGIPTIADILLEAGVVAAGQIQAALERQRTTGTRIGEALVELGAATEHDIGWALARQLGYTYLDLAPEALDPELLAGFPEGLLARLLAVPLLRSEHGLSVALGDPTDREAIAELERVTGTPILPTVAAPSAIVRALERVAGGRHEPGRRPAAGLVSASAHRALAARDGSGAALLAGHVRRALLAGAHEIHFLPAGDAIQVFHRVGRRLVFAGDGPAHIVYLLLARLEALGGPTHDGEQTHVRGRAVCPLSEQEVLLDVSLLRAESGLAIALGLRGSRVEVPTLERLGMDPVDLACVRGVLDQPSGLVLVSGPSRAGCSTTIASLLAAVPMEGRRSLAFERATGAPLPSPTRLSLPVEEARASWSDIVVGQAADVVAFDDVFTAEHVAGVLAADGSGRLLLVSTDWSDSFALVHFLASRPGGSQILGERLRLVIQQRMVALEPGRGADPDAGVELRPVFEVLCVSDAMRGALHDGASIARMRELAAGEQHRALAERLRALVEDGRVSAAEAARVAG